MKRKLSDAIGDEILKSRDSRKIRCLRILQIMLNENMTLEQVAEDKDFSLKEGDSCLFETDEQLKQLLGKVELLKEMGDAILESGDDRKIRCLRILQIMLNENMTLEQAAKDKNFPLQEGDSCLFETDEQLKQLLQKVSEMNRQSTDRSTVVTQPLQRFLERLEELENEGLFSNGSSSGLNSSSSKGSSSNSDSSSSNGSCPSSNNHAPKESPRGELEAEEARESYPNTPIGTPRKLYPDTPSESPRGELDAKAARALEELKRQGR